ncbi:MAG: Asp-tRNA(Asn)/Glu-tRNA(Gln) amidotransferase subunit GatB [Bacilli bacterium]|nr:Asp-tRNA(Asn)/Glu-tRNA(Gln) amidotransferase subunit GatB [Bacilli bacterium]
MLVPTIGIEIHVELKSKKKVFSPSINNFNDDANTNVDVIDMGYPGSLPLLNKEVVNMALQAALAFNCQINQLMHFDRKNYFYPDLPKGYQITQKDTPIGFDGYVEIEVDGLKKKIGIERIHIEEDTCKSIHSNDKTYLNFNRAGVPLIEIVSKPEITNEKEAVAYIEAIREILLYLGISDVKIEEGSMRCDANVSLKEEDSSVFGTKVEVKNIGSISNVALSISYEIERQKALLMSNETIYEQTRRFDDKTRQTILMRTKETGNDYRYFPEPDIPYVNISEDHISSVKNNLPVLPNEYRIEYQALGLNNNYIKTLIGNIELNSYYRKFISKINPIICANIITGELLSYLNKNKLTIKDIVLSDEELIKLVNMIEEGTLSSKQLKEVLPILLETDDLLEDILEKQGIKQISNETQLNGIISKIVNANPSSIKDYKEGKDRAIKYLMGQIMKETKGQANPKLANDILVAILKEQ